MSDHSGRLIVTAKGQITLRRKLLEHLGAKPGARLVVDLLPGGRAEIRCAEQGTLDAFFDCLADERRPPLSIEEMNAIIADGWRGEAMKVAKR